MEGCQIPIEGVEWRSNESGENMHKQVSKEGFRKAVFTQSTQKAPGLRQLGLNAIRRVCDGNFI